MQTHKYISCKWNKGQKVSCVSVKKRQEIGKKNTAEEDLQTELLGVCTLRARCDIGPDQPVRFSVVNSAFTPGKNHKRSRGAASSLRASLASVEPFLAPLGSSEGLGRRGGRESNMANETAVRATEWEREIN